MHRLFILFSIVSFSCSRTSKEVQEEPPPIVTTETTTPIAEVSEPDSLEMEQVELWSLFTSVTAEYPADSASLYDVYYRNHKAESLKEIDKQYSSLTNLLGKETKQKYDEVNSELVPLLTEISKSKSIEKGQVQRLVYLYTVYDDFRGKSLFSNLISDAQNYDLVWAAFNRMADQSPFDTTNISALITLDYKVFTNVELAEAVGEMVNRAIIFNPEGFLLMYQARDEQGKGNLAHSAMLWGDPVPEIVSVFDSLKQHTGDQTTRELASQLLDKISSYE